MLNIHIHATIVKRFVQSLLRFSWPLDYRRIAEGTSEGFPSVFVA